MKNIMSQLNTIFSIAIFRKRAQNLVASNQLMLVCLLAAITIGFINREFSTDDSSTLILAIAESVLYSGFVFVILALHRKPERFVQTISAILGTNAIIQLIALPLFVSSGQITTNVAETSDTIMVALLLVGGWSFAVSVFVLKEALEVRIAPAVLTTLGCQMATLIILVMLFPELTAEVGSSATQSVPPTTSAS
jgi:hypothetical protein